MSGFTDPRAAQLFEQGLALHRRGALREALAVYEQALLLQPGQFDQIGRAHV